MLQLLLLLVVVVVVVTVWSTCECWLLVDLPQHQTHGHVRSNRVAVSVPAWLCVVLRLMQQLPWL